MANMSRFGVGHPVLYVLYMHTSPIKEEERRRRGVGFFGWRGPKSATHSQHLSATATAPCLAWRAYFFAFEKIFSSTC